MSEEKMLQKSVAFLDYAVKSGLLNTDMSYEEIYDCFVRGDEYFSSSIEELESENA